MRVNDLGPIADALRRARNLLITSHVSPDGDAVGSMLALYQYARALGVRRVVCAMEDPVPRAYRWLPGADEVLDAATLTETFDVVALVDVCSLARIGTAADAVKPGTQVIVIDHHLDENPDGDVVFLDPARAAVGVIIADLFEYSEVTLTAEAAVCAYVALATDTGSFRFSNTTPRALRAAARLVEAGVDVASVANRIFDLMSPEKFKLMARVLNRTVLADGGRIGYSELTLKDMEETGASLEDVDGLVNLPRNIDGVEVSLLFRETGPDATKVSMRCRSSFNCAVFLKEFDGGGHAAAGGALVPLPLQRAREVVLERLSSAMESAP